MALAIRLKNQTDNVDIYLKVEDITDSINRKIITVPLPGNTILQLDLGMNTTSWKITGTADENETAAGNGNVGNYRDLKNMKAWYNDEIRLYFSTTHYAIGKIAKIDLRRSPFHQFWNFSIDFEVYSETYS